MSRRLQFLSVLAVAVGSAACSKPAPAAPVSAAPVKAVRAEQPLPDDPMNVVNIAANSKDHTTLVAALKAAEYVYAVSNPGPLTVFAPTNAAFDALPPGTVDTLVKPENQEQLRDILRYHVCTSVYEVANLKDGQELSMANGKRVKIGVADGKITVNGAPVVASIRGTNGVVHVIGTVLTPPAG